ncbi:MAG: hypothetical protein AB1689_08470 [Thermodesulfobacteriota bacterium]
MEKRRSVMATWRVVFWVVPVLVLSLTLGMNACGSDDDDECSDTIEFATEAQCIAYGELYDCDDYTYDDGVCSVFGCEICDIFDDDDDNDDDVDDIDDVF